MRHGSRAGRRDARRAARSDARSGARSGKRCFARPRKRSVEGANVPGGDGGVRPMLRDEGLGERCRTRRDLDELLLFAELILRRSASEKLRQAVSDDSWNGLRLLGSCICTFRDLDGALFDDRLDDRPADERRLPCSRFQDRSQECRQRVIRRRVIRRRRICRRLCWLRQDRGRERGRERGRDRGRYEESRCGRIWRPWHVARVEELSTLVF